MASPRRRNAVLASLDYFRERHPQVTLFNVVSFLYISENEGLSLAELAEVMNTTRATASRNARALTGPDDEGSIAPSLGFIEIQQNPYDGRGRVLVLTPAGLAARDHLDRLIGLATPIVQPPCTA